MSALRLLDLFSGIGGFSLGLERQGFRTVAFCEIDRHCRRVLAQHWPEVPIYDDVRDLTAERLAADGIAVDAICGGFPCQDISTAGKGGGIDGARSGLWAEYARLVRELRPAIVIVENVAALLGRGLDRVLGDLAACRYDAEWQCLPVAALGAPHIRERVFVVAYPDSGRFAVERQQEHAGLESSSWREPDGFRAAGWGHGAALAHPALDGRGSWGTRDAEEGPRGRQSGGGGVGADVADPNGWGCDNHQGRHAAESDRDKPQNGILGARSDVADTCEPRLPLSEYDAILTARRWIEGRAAAERGWWSVEPDVGRVAHGVPNRVDRLRGLGNAVVPQLPEIIGHAVTGWRHENG